MEKIIINTAKELKEFVSKNRLTITNINGVQFGEMYPIIECSNKHTSYYDVQSQSNKFLNEPFIVK